RLVVAAEERARDTHAPQEAMVQVRIVDRLQQPLGLLEVADGRAVFIDALVRGSRVEQRFRLGLRVAQLDGLGARLQRGPQRLDRRADDPVTTRDEEEKCQPLATGLLRQQRYRLREGGLRVATVERPVEGGKV